MIVGAAVTMLEMRPAPRSRSADPTEKKFVPNVYFAPPMSEVAVVELARAAPSVCIVQRHAS